MIFAGIDAGSRTIKAVLIDAQSGEITASEVRDQLAEQHALAEDLLSAVLKAASLRRRDVRRIVATGYGREIVSFADSTVTEITCQSRGVRHLCPAAMTVIDVGGQDTKLIRLDHAGMVRDFTMNERCAAGAGRFLEVVAQRLGFPLDEFARMAAESSAPAHINATCVVFAESEIIGLLAAGVSPRDIAAGVQDSLAARVSKMLGRGVEPPVVLTGGVALLPGMAAVLEHSLDQKVVVAPSPQLTCAIGAALVAADQVR